MRTAGKGCDTAKREPGEGQFTWQVSAQRGLIVQPHKASWNSRSLVQLFRVWRP